MYWELWVILLAVILQWDLGMISEIFRKDAKKWMIGKRIYHKILRDNRRSYGA
jgi:hypothetical protein